MSARESALPGATLLPVEDPAPSPCIGVCEMDPRHQWCVGCYRTIDEITDWFKLDDAKKRTILEQVRLRKLEAGDND